MDVIVVKDLDSREDLAGKVETREKHLTRVEAVEVEDHEDRVIGVADEEEVGLFLRNNESPCWRRKEVKCLKVLDIVHLVVVAIQLDALVVFRGGEEDVLWETEHSLNQSW